MKKAAAASAGARTRTKTKSAVQPRPKPQRATAGVPKATDHGYWSVIPSGQGSMLRLAAEPQTTIRLSPAQIKARQTARTAAKKDPAAHVAEVRSAS